MDYHLTLRVRNGRIKQLMEDMSIHTNVELSRRSGISVQTIGELINMKKSPYKSDKDSWRDSVHKLANFFGVEPKEMFPDRLAQITTNKIETYVEEAQLAQISRGDISHPQIEYVESVQLKDLIQKRFDEAKLTSREKQLLTLRFANGLTYSECGRQMGVSVERCRQIGIKAIKKIKSTSSFTKFPLKEFL